MKAEREIRDKIEAAKRTFEKHRKTLKDGVMPTVVMDNVLVDCEATIDALSWVLGENDNKNCWNCKHYVFSNIVYPCCYCTKWDKWEKK